MNAKCVYHKDAQLQDLGGGVSRRVLAYTPLLMTVEVSFEQGSTGAVHTHPHCQNTYILSRGLTIGKRNNDDGGFIKGNRIDLFYNTNAECIDFGRRNVRVYILEQ